MIVALIAALALSATLVGLHVWVLRRTFSSGDRALVTLEKAAELQRQLDARGVAVADRDRVIESLESSNKRLRAALELASAAPSLPSTDATSEESTRAMRDALSSLSGVVSERMPPMPAGPTTSLKDR